MTSRTIRQSATDPESLALSAADPELGALIDRVGTMSFGPIGDPFAVLARSIVSQQLSEASARAIWDRLQAVGATAPQGALAASDEALRAVGLSARKAEYLRGLAESVLSGDLDLGKLERLDDEAVIAELSRYRGIGRWTAEMYLIFALGRPDVLAIDDMGVRISAGKLLGLGRAATREELRERGELWKPYRSTASIWLWAMD